MNTSPLKADSRAQFEAWFHSRYDHISMPPVDRSVLFTNQWASWQASRTAIVVEPPKAEFFLVWDGKKHSATFTEATENYSAILRAAGITVKGDS